MLFTFLLAIIFAPIEWPNTHLGISIFLRKPIVDSKLRTVFRSVLIPANKKKRGSMLHCCVPQCNNDSRYHSSLSFHCFPKKDKQLRAMWIVKIRRDISESFQVGINYNCNSNYCEIALHVLLHLCGYLNCVALGYM